MRTFSAIISAPRRGVDLAIRSYQRRLSPRKGFTCAHLVARGGLSCSEAIRLVVLDRGVVAGFVPALARLWSCHEAAVSLQRNRPDRVRGVCCCGGIPIPFRL